MTTSLRRPAGSAGLILCSVLTLAGCSRASGPAPPPVAPAKKLPAIALGEKPAFPLKAHLESADIAAGKYKAAEFIDFGGDLFHTPFNGLDGVGVAVGPGGTKVNRFAPIGPTGPAVQTCGECHNTPFPSSAGLAHSSVSRDPDSDGKAPFNARSATSLYGDGIIQMLAEEMTEALQSLRDEAATAAKAAPGKPVMRDLVANGTKFGSIAATAAANGTVTFDVSKVQGVDPDLVVRPMDWKGDVTNLRTFSAVVSIRAMGMQPEEMVWRVPAGAKNPDLDGDGVVRELSVGDVTAMTVYMAALETPTEFSRLAALGHVQAPTSEQTALVDKGRAAFMSAGCATCHTPEMHLGHTKYEEPTARGNGNYYDHTIAAHDPNYDPKRPFTFDVLTDAFEPRLEADPKGGATVRLYGDLKRHAMGRLLADPAGPSDTLTSDLAPLKWDGKPVMIPADTFLTPELWGAGNTGPWLHDNRAGTLKEAVLLHGEDAPPAVGQPGRSEAQESRDAFKALAPADQEALIAFLTSLRTFALPERKDAN
jgi:mono/diheme cytochrome c family protein